MSTQPYRVSSSRRIEARPGRVYAAIADYREQHPRIIPPEYFSRLEVLEGGIGAGTRTRVEMRVLGMTRVLEQVVTEPEPGRVLVETNQDGSGVTTFTVEGADNGECSQVSITTDIVARRGVSGFLERLFTSLLLPRIYRMELVRLAEYVARHRADGRSGLRPTSRRMERTRPSGSRAPSPQGVPSRIAEPRRPPGEEHP